MIFEKRAPMEISPECAAKIAAFSFISAVFVVIMHADIFLHSGRTVQFVLRGLLSKGITQVAVPFFFIVSGFLLAGKMGQTGWWKRSVKSRIQSLVMPYVAWDVLYTGGILVVLWLCRHGFEDSLANALISVCPCGIDRWSHLPGLRELWVSADGPMWYVRSLFILVLLSPLYSVLRFDRYGVLMGVMFALVFLLMFVVAPHSAIVVKFLKTTLEWRGCLYFGVGVWLRYNAPTVSKRLYLLAGALGLVIWYVDCFLDACPFGYYFWIPLAMGAIWGLVPSLRIPRKVCRLSFPIFVIHDFVMWIMRGVLDYRAPALWKYILAIVSVMGISSACAVLIGKISVLDKIFFGGRWRK